MSACLKQRFKPNEAACQFYTMNEWNTLLLKIQDALASCILFQFDLETRLIKTHHLVATIFFGTVHGNIGFFNQGMQTYIVRIEFRNAN